jgi:hypothetical protein
MLATTPHSNPDPSELEDISSLILSSGDGSPLDPAAWSSISTTNPSQATASLTQEGSYFATFYPIINSSALTSTVQLPKTISFAVFLLSFIFNLKP